MKTAEPSPNLVWLASLIASILIFGSDDCRRWAEEFAIEGSHARGDIRQDSGGIPPSLTIGNRSTKQALGAVGNGLLHLGMMVISQILSGKRPKTTGLVRGILHFICLHGIQHVVDELIRDTGCHDQPLRRDAHLSVGEHSCSHDLVDRKIEIRIVKDNIRITATKFHHGLLEGGTGLSRHYSTGLTAARERDTSNGIVIDDLFGAIRINHDRPEQILGKPASRNSDSMASPHPKTQGACLRTTELPAMIVGATDLKTCHKGKFQGMIA